MAAGLPLATCAFDVERRHRADGVSARPESLGARVMRITGSGFLITGILLPWLAWVVYLLRSAQPRWWAASLISLAAFVLGTAITGVIGSLAMGLGA